jgi:hypothetical protein
VEGGASKKRKETDERLGLSGVWRWAAAIRKPDERLRLVWGSEIQVRYSGVRSWQKDSPDERLGLVWCAKMGGSDKETTSYWGSSRVRRCPVGGFSGAIPCVESRAGKKDTR